MIILLYVSLLLNEEEEEKNVFIFTRSYTFKYYTQERRSLVIKINFENQSRYPIHKQVGKWQ